MPSPVPILPWRQTIARNDPVLLLIAANLFTIVLALVQGWNFATVILVYWFQSVTIGFFTVMQILTFPADGAWGASPETRMRMGSRSFPMAGPITGIRKMGVAGFFTLHYGLFHPVYLGFIPMDAFVTGTGLQGIPDILIACVFFFANHLYSFLFYRSHDEGERMTLMEIFVRPYARIIPMHLTIIGGGFLLAFAGGAGMDANRLVVLFFLCLKTLMDMEGHQRKHRQPPGEDTGMEGT